MLFWKASVCLGNLRALLTKVEDVGDCAEVGHLLVDQSGELRGRALRQVDAADEVQLWSTRVMGPVRLLDRHRAVDERGDFAERSW